jgi:hypothetical protein
VSRRKTRGKKVFVLDAEHAIIISKIDAAYVYELIAIHVGALSRDWTRRERWIFAEERINTYLLIMPQRATAATSGRVASTFLLWPCHVPLVGRCLVVVS